MNLLSAKPTLFSEPGTVLSDEVRTTEMWFYPSPGVDPSRTDINTPALVIAGDAFREDSLVKFRGRLILNDTWLRAASAGDPGNQTIEALRQVRGIRSQFKPSEGGTLLIQIDARRLFEGADFSNLLVDTQPVDADGETRILLQTKDEPGTDQVMKTLFNRLRASSGTYSIRWENLTGITTP